MLAVVGLERWCSTTEISAQKPAAAVTATRVGRGWTLSAVNTHRLEHRTCRDERLHWQTLRQIMIHWNCMNRWGKKIILSLSLSLSLSLAHCFNGHSPGEPGLAGVYWSKGWWKWWWQLELQVVQSSSQIITTNKPTPSLFYRPDALPVAQPTASKHWRETKNNNILIDFISTTSEYNTNQHTMQTYWPSNTRKSVTVLQFNGKIMRVKNKTLPKLHQICNCCWFTTDNVVHQMLNTMKKGGYVKNMYDIHLTHKNIPLNDRPITSDALYSRKHVTGTK